MIVPDFFVIGAPKCGTTSLCNWLDEHPEIYISEPKETFYFDSDIKSRFPITAEQYSELFVEARKVFKLLGEGSTTYAYSNEAIKNILKLNPNAKFIFLWRDPVEMAPALHEQELFSLHESEKSFERAWHLQDIRIGGKEIPKNCSDVKKLMYRDICSLGTQLRKLKSEIPEGQLFVGAFETLKNDPITLYKSILKFLCVDYDGRVIFENKNPSKRYRSRILNILIINLIKLKRRIGITKGFGVSQLNTKKINRQPVSPEFRKKLESEFSEERKIIDDILAGKDVWTN